MNTSSRTIEAAVASAAILMSMSSGSAAYGAETGAALRNLRIDPSHIGATGAVSLGLPVAVNAASLGSTVELDDAIPHVVSVLGGSSYPTLINVTDVIRVVERPARIAAAPVSRLPAFPDLAAPEEMVIWAKQLWGAFPEDARLPAIWSDVGEIAFEWIWGKQHAILSIDEDGIVGYAMLDGERFSPGQENGSLKSFPADLLNYLRKT
ncbi:hypothetical protein [Mesorhizobium sp. B2-3-15]|uniref:hypothetical protein n=1 Tax=Mesorhizobium sp. B2-3-15 TaxID=2589949 RepID=UPI00112DE14C|nr:hypothetical protein [Mesorhizobium sp. B2-3-15]TPL64101.1 hypothetical protein FJ954_29775 [Mesorhizobium sp. B2-3-15]